MSAAVCGSKRSFFEDLPPSPPLSKRLRCSSSTSPIRFSAPSLLDQLRAIFPNMDNQVVLALFVCVHIFIYINILYFENALNWCCLGFVTFDDMNLFGRWESWGNFEDLLQFIIVIFLFIWFCVNLILSFYLFIYFLWLSFVWFGLPCWNWYHKNDFFFFCEFIFIWCRKLGIC